MPELSGNDMFLNMNDNKYSSSYIRQASSHLK